MDVDGKGLTPILQALVTIAVDILFRILLLSQVSLVISCDFPHMFQIILGILGGIFLRVLLQDLYDLSSTIIAVSIGLFSTTTKMSLLLRLSAWASSLPLMADTLAGSIIL